MSDKVLTITYYEKKLGTSNDDPIFHSSFSPANSLSDESHYRRVVASFLNQSQDVTEPLINIINRIRRKREPVIIEGVNIVTSKIFERIPHDHFNKFMLINLYIDDKNVHIKRLRERGKSSNESPEETDRYIKHIDNIRILDVFIKEDSQKNSQDNPCLVSYNNDGSLSQTVDFLDKKIKAFLRHGEEN